MKTYSLDVIDYSIKKHSDKQFMFFDAYLISDGVNRNKSNFLSESFKYGIPTIYNKPILAYYNKSLNDVEEHNSRLNIDTNGNTFYDYQYETAERSVGVIPNTTNISIVEKDGKNWIHIENALIWVEYNKQLVDLLSKVRKKKVSVEVEVLESYMDGDIEVITKWVFCGVTLLGKYPNGMSVSEGIEGAHMSVKEFAESEEFKNYRKRMSFAMNRNNKDEILNKYKMSVTMSELTKAIQAKLNNYFVDIDDKTYSKYWINDIIIDDNIAIVECLDDGKLYAVPYEIDGEIIVHLEDMKEAELKYTYCKTGYKHELFISKEDYGTEPPIEINDSKKYVSNDKWGDINKTHLRNTVLKAKNYKSLVKSVYLLVERGWENSPSEKLKYPVMQYKNDRLVYNSNGLLAAQIYGEKYNKNIAEKAKAIREKLGLIKPEKEEKMNKFIEFAEANDLRFIGEISNKLVFSKFDEENTLETYYLNKCENPDEHEPSMDDFEKCSLKFEDDEDDEDDDCDCEELKDKNKELSEKLECKTNEYNDLLEKFNNIENELNEKNMQLETIKMNKMKDEANCIMEEENINTDDKKELNKMIDNKCFNSIEDFIKEMSYRKYKSEKKNRSMSFSIYKQKNNKETHLSGLESI